MWHNDGHFLTRASSSEAMRRFSYGNYMAPHPHVSRPVGVVGIVPGFSNAMQSDTLQQGGTRTRQQYTQMQDMATQQADEHGTSKRTKAKDDPVDSFPPPPVASGTGAPVPGQKGPEEMQRTSSNITDLLVLTKSLIQRMETDGGLMNFIMSGIDLPGGPHESKGDPAGEEREPHEHQPSRDAPRSCADIACRQSPAASGQEEPSKKEKVVKVKKIFLRILRKVMEIPNESPLVRAPPTSDF
eukprot:4077127-Pyramimonas_sp.AAC.1